MLSQIRIVLVETTHPGNIGATARAMKTMGLGELWLVRPRLFPSAEATARASGADDVLAAAQVVDDAAEAVAGCRLVMGTSNRQRSLGQPCLDPREAAARLSRERGQLPAAILFGPEHSGLSNAHLDLCHLQVTIPAAADFPSLNIAAAVQVIAYELRMAALAAKEVAGIGGRPPAHLPVDAAEMERFYRHLEEVLVAIEFLDPANPRQLMRRLRRLYHRCQPDENEMNILRGILTSIQRKISTFRDASPP